MSFIDTIKYVFSNYVTFTGRASRKEYWYFVVFNMLAGVVLGIISGIFETNILTTIYSLAILLPSYAVSIRRLHDTGRSGWWILIGFIPLVNIAYLVFLCLDSQPGDNKYGPNPKGF